MNVFAQILSLFLSEVCKAQISFARHKPAHTVLSFGLLWLAKSKRFVHNLTINLAHCILMQIFSIN